MRISEAKKCIKELYLKADCVTALVSERGVGKTSAYQQCADELDIGYMGLYAAALEGPDFMGLPDKDKEKGITRYLAPQFLPTKQAVKEGLFPKAGILVLEEINRVPSDTISVLYPLLLEKRINGHSLAPGWKIGVTMNPDTMNYAVNSLDDAMLDRFVTVEITANLEDYIDFSINNRPNDDVLSYLEACPDMLLMVKKRADSTASSKAPTPRGWSRVQELLNQCSLDEKLMFELISGILGPETAASFYGFIRNRDFKIPSADVLLQDFDRIKEGVLDVVKKGRLDILSFVIKRVVLSLELNEVQIRNTDRFIKSLPEELGILFYKTLAAKRLEDFDEIVSRLETFEPLSDKIIDMLG